MRFCREHWAMARASVDKFNLTSLVAKDTETAITDAIADLRNEPDEKHERFDPLMSLYAHFTSNALRCGGLYLMGQTPDGSNDGHYCPICEFEKNTAAFSAGQEMEKVAAQIADWCRGQGLIARVS